MAAKRGADAPQCWYREFWAQTWYRNTFLVRHPREIGRAVRDERDWNNVYDSGCNFACIAMIVGVDPARLASELSRQPFFQPDRETPCRMVTGVRGLLVWDRNEPQAATPAVRISQIWSAMDRCRVTVLLRFVGEDVTFDHTEGKRIVRDARRRGEHVIAGAREHSHLVAGSIGDDFYLWDPDDTTVSVEESLAGKLTLKSLFGYYAGREPIEFWRYSVRRKIHPLRAPPRQWHYQR